MPRASHPEPVGWHRQEATGTPGPAYSSTGALPPPVRWEHGPQWGRNPKSLASAHLGPDPEAVSCDSLELTRHLASGAGTVSGRRAWTSRGQCVTDAGDCLAQGFVAPFCPSAQGLSVPLPAPSIFRGSLPKSAAQLPHLAYFSRRLLSTTGPSAYWWFCPSPSSVGASGPVAWHSSFLYKKTDNEGCAL